MFKLQRWIRRSNQTACLLGIVLLSLLPAYAEFFPDKGITATHWKAPIKYKGYDEYYWLNDHELVYTQHWHPDGSGWKQYIHRDLTTGKDQDLEKLTKVVCDTLDDPWEMPAIFPSPDRKYLAWVGRDQHYVDTLVVATRDGVIISQQPNNANVHYISWSADSQWCFSFLDGRSSDGIFGERRVFKAITAISMKTPSVVKTYPIALKPEEDQSALSGHRYFLSLHGDALPLLPDFHFGSENNIFLVSHKWGELSEDIQFDEYSLSDTSKPVATHTLHLPIPYPWEINYAVFSPAGDAIVWQLRRGDDIELWLSDGNGVNLKRIGKFYQGDPTSPPNVIHLTGDLYPIRWLPDGKAISFREKGELWVVHVR